METIKFSSNWNSKCNCNYFITIRLKQPKYKVGNQLNMLIQRQGIFRDHGLVRVYSCKPLKLYQINDYISRLDASMSPNELKNELYSLYREKVKDINSAEFLLILLERVRLKVNQQNLF